MNFGSNTVRVQWVSVGIRLCWDWSGTSARARAFVRKRPLPGFPRRKAGRTSGRAVKRGAMHPSRLEPIQHPRARQRSEPQLSTLVDHLRRAECTHLRFWVIRYVDAFSSYWRKVKTARAISYV